MPWGFREEVLVCYRNEQHTYTHIASNSMPTIMYLLGESYSFSRSPRSSPFILCTVQLLGYCTILHVANMITINCRTVFTTHICSNLKICCSKEHIEVSFIFAQPNNFPKENLTKYKPSNREETKLASSYEQRLQNRRRALIVLLPDA